MVLSSHSLISSPEEIHHLNQKLLLLTF
jgi:hypothetical protein